MIGHCCRPTFVKHHFEFLNLVVIKMINRQACISNGIALQHTKLLAVTSKAKELARVGCKPGELAERGRELLVLSSECTEPHAPARCHS